NRWVHVRLVVSGYTASLYVDGAAQPQLVVVDLKRPWARGSVGLWGRLGGANFANLAVQASDASPPAAKPQPEPSRRILATWDLSPALETASTPADAVPDAKAVPA